MDLERIKNSLTQAGWIVKDGTLYGAEFILYKESQGHTHGKYLVKLIPESKSVNIKKQGAWALSNLCRGKPLPNYDNMMDCVPIFSALIKEFLDDENVINDCIWALNYFSG